MTSASRLLTTLYLATSTYLAWWTVLTLGAVPPWFTLTLAACTAIPVTAALRETTIATLREQAADLRTALARRPLADGRPLTPHETAALDQLDASLRRPNQPRSSL